MKWEYSLNKRQQVTFNRNTLYYLFYNISLCTRITFISIHTVYTVQQFRVYIKYFMLTTVAFIWSKNIVKTVILWNIITVQNNLFLFEYILQQ